MQKRISLILLFIGMFFISFGQIQYVDSLKLEYDKNYGLDVLLHNGKKNDLYYKKHSGHPFWKTEDILKADLVIDERKYRNQDINYNLETQEFILSYKNYHGAVQQLVLNSSIIDSVFTGDCTFIPKQTSILEQDFVQLIYDGRIKCVTTRTKSLKIKNNVSSISGLAYSEESKDIYLIIDNRLNRINKKRGFFKSFNKKYKADLKKFMATEKISYKNISDGELKKLVVYCEDLMYK